MFEILTPLETLDRIRNGFSLSRFGPCELVLMYEGQNAATHKYDAGLARRLREILEREADFKEHLVCIPDFICQAPRPIDYSQIFVGDWEDWRERYRGRLPEKLYGSSYISRPEMLKTRFDLFSVQLRRCLSHRSFIFVGSYYKTHCRVVDGFAADVNSEVVHFIDTPATDAYADYPSILNSCRSIGSDNFMFLLSIGSTATVLANDLHVAGFQAVDIGNLFRNYQGICDLKC